MQLPEALSLRTMSQLNQQSFRELWSPLVVNGDSVLFQAPELPYHNMQNLSSIT